MEHQLGGRWQNQSPKDLREHGEPPEAVGIAEPETAVKTGWGLDGREGREDGEDGVCGGVETYFPGVFLLFVSP